MKNKGSTSAVLVELPEQKLMQLTLPLAHFLRIEALGGVLLLAATLCALILANSPWSANFLAFWETPVGFQVGPVEVNSNLKHVISDGVMTLFFFVVGLEIKRELALGELQDIRAAALPGAAALGGMLVPAGIYLALQIGQPGQSGWGVVMATDIAFVVGCLALLGKRAPHSLRIFVLSLAIIDDIGAILVIAVGYAGSLEVWALWLGLSGVACVVAMQRLGVRAVPAYYIVGVLTWVAIYNSGVHPTIVGVVFGLLTPARPWVGEQRFQMLISRLSVYLRPDIDQRGEDDRVARNDLMRGVAFAARETLSPLERIEAALHPWVSIAIMPLFAFANAGVPLTLAGLTEPVSLAVIAGLVFGKPIGILLACWLAVRLGVAIRQPDLKWSVIFSAGVLCGIGFTMSIFIATLAFDASALAAAKLGILAASLLAALVGQCLLLLTCPRPPAEPEAS